MTECIFFSDRVNVLMKYLLILNDLKLGIASITQDRTYAGLPQEFYALIGQTARTLDCALHILEDQRPEESSVSALLKKLNGKLHFFTVNDLFRCWTAMEEFLCRSEDQDHA